MLPLIANMKNTAEEGRQLPKEIQLIDSVGAGMVAGIGYSFPFSGVDLVKLAKAQFPAETSHAAVERFVEQKGALQMSRILTDSCARSFSRGALFGMGYFAADQGYKTYKKHKNLT